MINFLLAILLVAALLNLLHQVRKPGKWAGRFFLWIMNRSHSEITDWGLSHVEIAPGFTILDVGCGGGRTIAKLSALASAGKVHGVDFADGSVAASRAYNAQGIGAGRIEVRQASVSHLPYPDDKFDLVTAAETQYYRPDLVGDMREVLRVLKPGGRLLVIVENYEKGGRRGLQRSLMDFLKTLSVDDQRDLFAAAGYEEVQVFEEREKGWLCAVGVKASS